MAERFAELPTQLRPHIKVHKSPELARLQLEAGAIGVATATVWEAIVMAQAGIPDVLVANQVVGAEKERAVAELARNHRVTLAVDSVASVDRLAAAAVAAGSQLELLIELDVGMGRCGVRTAVDALKLASRIAEHPSLRFRGMQGYEGHCMLEPDYDVRVEAAQTANAMLVDAVETLERAGFPSSVVSAGGTGTYFITGANPRVTEIQAGSYTVMDGMHGNLVPGGFSVAATVLGTVVSRQGNTIVLDSGRKSVGIDFVAPVIVGHENVGARYFAEEHALFDFPGTSPFEVGDRVELVPGYAPTTVNLYDVYHVVERDVVTSIWPVSPRGPGGWAT